MTDLFGHTTPAPTPRALTDGELRKWRELIATATPASRQRLADDLLRTLPKDDTDNRNQFGTRLYGNDLAVFASVVATYQVTAAELLRDCFRHTTTQVRFHDWYAPRTDEDDE